MKRALKRRKNIRVLLNKENIYGDLRGVYGDAKNIRGDVSAIYGDVTNIRGDVSLIMQKDTSWLHAYPPDTRFNLTQISGDVSGLKGNITGIQGDATGFEGDVDDCELSKEDRIRNPWIQDLVGD